MILQCVCYKSRRLRYHYNTNPNPAQLDNALVSNTKTNFYCYAYHQVSDSLQKQAAQTELGR